MRGGGLLTDCASSVLSRPGSAPADKPGRQRGKAGPLPCAVLPSSSSSVRQPRLFTTPGRAVQGRRAVAGERKTPRLCLTDLASNNEQFDELDDVKESSGKSTKSRGVDRVGQGKYFITERAHLQAVAACLQVAPRRGTRPGKVVQTAAPSHWRH